MENNKTMMTVAIVTFIVGLIIGFGIWGSKKEEKADVKQSLAQAIQDFEEMEKENKELKADLEKAKRDKVSRENKELKEQIEGMRQENESLQAEINKLKGEAAHAALQVKSSEELRSVIDEQRGRLAELDKENQDLKLIIEKINSLTARQEAAPPEQSVEESAHEQTQDEPAVLEEAPAEPEQ